jgi:hypothetical protein
MDPGMAERWYHVVIPQSALCDRIWAADATAAQAAALERYGAMASLIEWLDLEEPGR